MYWMMHIVIILLNILLAFKLIPKATKLSIVLFGLISGVGLLVFQFITHEIFNAMLLNVENASIISLFIIEYLVQIICLEWAIRKKYTDI